MSLLQGYALRPPRLGDASAPFDQDLDLVVALYEAADMADVGFIDPARTVLLEAWNSAQVDPAEDVRLVVATDGSVLAYAEVTGTHRRTWQEAFIRVHPNHRGAGLGAVLLAWAEGRARTFLQAGDRCRFTPSVAATDATTIADLETAGYERVRTFWHMERDLPARLEAPEPPAGIKIRAFREGHDERMFHATLEEAFADHFGWQAMTFEEFATVELAASPFWEPGLTAFATEDERVVGLVEATRNGDVGWIGTVGVVPAHRGRGIGSALLMHAFSLLVGRGFNEVRLNVDAGNETGATRLYERVGMTVRREWLVFEKLLAAD